jgi:tRNA 2-thiouridine synthesizing protein D
MKYAIQVNSSPHQANSADTAYQFIKAALEMGHEVVRVFFYQEGIYHALRYATPPSDEVQVVTRWTKLAEDYDLDLVYSLTYGANWISPSTPCVRFNFAQKPLR